MGLQRLWTCVVIVFTHHLTSLNAGKVVLISIVHLILLANYHAFLDSLLMPCVITLLWLTAAVTFWERCIASQRNQVVTDSPSNDICGLIYICAIALRSCSQVTNVDSWSCLKDVCKNLWPNFLNEEANYELELTFHSSDFVGCW